MQNIVGFFKTAVFTLSDIVDPYLIPHETADFILNEMPNDLVNEIFQNLSPKDLMRVSWSGPRYRKFSLIVLKSRFSNHSVSSFACGIKKVEHAVEFLNAHEIEKVDLRDYGDSVTDQVLQSLFQTHKNLLELHISSLTVTDLSIQQLPKSVSVLGLTLPLNITHHAFNSGISVKTLILNGYYFEEGWKDLLRQTKNLTIVNSLAASKETITEIDLENIRMEKYPNPFDYSDRELNNFFDFLVCYSEKNKPLNILELRKDSSYPYLLGLRKDFNAKQLPIMQL